MRLGVTLAALFLLAGCQSGGPGPVPIPGIFEACGSEDNMRRRFDKAHGETQHWSGFSNRGVIIKLWDQGEGGNWSLTFSNAQGAICMYDNGILSTHSR